MTKFVRVLKISLEPTYLIQHVHLKHDIWPYLRPPTIIKQIICSFIHSFIHLYFIQLKTDIKNLQKQQKLNDF